MGSILGIRQQETENPIILTTNPREIQNTTESMISIQQNQIDNNKNIISAKCFRCSKYVEDDDFFSQNCGQVNCLFKFHKNCFFKELYDQRKKKGSLYYKCKCGTKIPSKFLRNCDASNKMDLLSTIHRRQLDLIIKQSILRKNQEVLEYYFENKEKYYELDYFLSEQDQLIYKDTPQ
ncbi:unnamed protein product [Paramecium sonneborni]|uniref:Uncharacterized protein n=1 Tax=Paramecium sonneborni TaxID=65129 RepID=A0A8S1QLJ8_9CILI|nr:unnamed protein product [Paramecium sonneborni]